MGERRGGKKLGESETMDATKAGIPRQQTASSELNRIQLDEAIRAMLGEEVRETESMKEEGKDGVGGAMVFLSSRVG